MKDFQELIEDTTELVEDNLSKDQMAENVLRTLEQTEFYLKRKLTESEFNTFSDLLLEEEMQKKEQNSNQFLKRGTYKVELITPQGKVTSTATSQKGVLDLISKARKKGAKFRILDATKGNQDITGKVNKVLMDKRKQEELRKKVFGQKNKKRFMKDDVSLSNENFLEESKGSFFKNLMGKFLGRSSKEAAQQGSESTAKQTAKETAEEGAEALTRETGQETGQQVARKAGKEMAERGAREAGEEMAERGAREAGEEAVEGASKGIGKKALKYGGVAAAATLVPSALNVFRGPPTSSADSAESEPYNDDETKLVQYTGETGDGEVQADETALNRMWRRRR